MFSILVHYQWETVIYTLNSLGALQMSKAIAYVTPFLDLLLSQIPEGEGIIKVDGHLFIKLSTFSALKFKKIVEHK